MDYMLNQRYKLCFKIETSDDYEIFKFDLATAVWFTNMHKYAVQKRQKMFAFFRWL